MRTLGACLFLLALELNPKPGAEQKKVLDQIKQGMTQQEVAKIVGDKYSNGEMTIQLGFNDGFYFWRDESYHYERLGIWVTYRNDKVQSAIYWPHSSLTVEYKFP